LDIVRRLLDPGVVGIIRTDNPARLIEATRALAVGGITAIEVTMTTPSALEVIREARATLGDQILMGVGTVLDAETARAAMLAGAQFVITPVVRPEVIRICNRYSIPIATGAATPTEALTAHEMGSDFIKLFPAENLGPAYIKSILAPLPMLQFIPTGGVTPENVAAFFSAGCVAVGAGSSLLRNEDVKAGAWGRVTARAAEFVAAAREGRSK
jgi:2-dehydro-3-deoxyphosphogluconate aldolase/(4S)-4-hydroxy-2-oxoglutarate aldolase